MEFENVLRLYEQWVIASITGAQIGERAYCLVIGYDADDPDDVHVSLGVGLDRERRGEGAGSRKRWYNPADFANFDTPRLGALTCPKVQAPPRTEDEWRDLYVTLARRLALRDWSDDLPVTEDFVTYATDYHLEHLAANFHLCVPVALRERLLADGWISEQMAHGQESP